MRPISRICNFKGENVVIGIVAFFAGIIATLIFFSASGHEWSTRFQRDAWTTLGYYKRGKLYLLHMDFICAALREW